ncbi:GNAT family N-acetyltransferase [Nocardioides yefusunii]|uniref:GNAT family N-acetyltransferase n=1 Tax=Nocardioides yefusunii TaxID=2500546 RepID=A0ABW1QXC2_9ACTN|nr:GNAT family N-acetyltransferase [Nocardioides yefusunii]
MEAPVQIRSARPEEQEAFESVVRAAFADEGDVVVRVLRELVDRELVCAIIVAERNGTVVGTVALSLAWVDARERLVEIALLSPLAVHPDEQNRGTGALLLDAAFDAAQQMEFPLVALEGDPAYYASRGWEQSSDHGVLSPSARVPEAACRVRLTSSYEEWVTGRIVYPDTWWRHDTVGLRDPLLAQVEAAPEGVTAG